MRSPLTCQINVCNIFNSVSLVKVWKTYNEIGVSSKMRTKINVSYYTMLGIFHAGDQHEDVI